MKTVLAAMLLVLCAGCLCDKPCRVQCPEASNKQESGVDTQKKIALVNYGELNNVCETWFMQSESGIKLSQKKTEVALKDEQYLKKNPQEGTSPYLSEMVSVNNAIDAELKALAYKYVEKYTKGKFIMVIEDSAAISFMADDVVIIDVTPKIKSEILKDLAGSKR
jgi:hypothetical protein